MTPHCSAAVIRIHGRRLASVNRRVAPVGNWPDAISTLTMPTRDETLFRLVNQALPPSVAGHAASVLPQPRSCTSERVVVPVGQRREHNEAVQKQTTHRHTSLGTHPNV